MYKHKHRRGALAELAAITITIAAVLILPSSTAAYQTLSGKWQNTSTIAYYIDPNLDAALAPGASNSVDTAASKWNTSRVTLSRQSAYHPNIITTANFATSPPCLVPGATDMDDFVGLTCASYSDSANRSYSVARMYFNTSGTWSWNTSGILNCSTNQVDVWHTALHEFGHFYGLADNPAGHPEAVMSYSCSLRRELQEDDKHGVTLIYGVRTTWEAGFAYGETNTIALWNGLVGSYDGNIYGFPIIGRVTAEQPVSTREVVYPKNGSWMERFAGCSEQSHSFAYMRLFTEAANSNTSGMLQERPYLQIRSGMHLVYAQYNFQQNTFGVDFKMVDAAGNRSFLRDSGLRDTAGISVHPTARGNRDLARGPIGYPVKQWFMTDIDLSPLEGKKIIEWMIGYDNGGVIFGTAPCVGFRAYFDDLRIVYPAGSLGPDV